MIRGEELSKFLGSIRPPNNCRLIIGGILLAGCNTTLSDYDRDHIDRQLHNIAQISQLPAPIASLTYSDARYFNNKSAEADCGTWNITINYSVAASRPDFIISKVLPHEYAHLMSCFYRGNMDGGDGEVHDRFWKQAVRQLGGDPDFI